MSKEGSSKESLDEKNLTQLRDVLLGKNYSFITEKVREQSRETVKNVIVEAINDRQKQGSDVDALLQPIVERSVESSLTARSDKLISALYPLVGSLVRKSVKTFLNDFIEKTNQLLENSLTLKSIQWRIRAKQAGIPFAQYMASQTFVYRVEHILLIHRETGVLLNSVNSNELSDSNVDLISSMLTAINDFVADSLITNNENEEQLQTIRTNNFSLLLKPGPEAMVVTAVIGNPPHNLLKQMELSLENIHRFYDDELHNFNGDTKLFNGTSIFLNKCLLSEEKNLVKNDDKKTWAFYFILLSFSLGGLYALWNIWQCNVLEEKIIQLNNEAGYSVQAIDVNFNRSVTLELIRDPATLPVKKWLHQQGINVEKIQIKEQLFYSADSTLVKKKIDKVLIDYPDVVYLLEDTELRLGGTLALNDKEDFLNKISTIVSPLLINVNFSDISFDIKLKEIDANNTELQQQLFYSLLAEFNLYQLDFDINQAEVNQKMQIKLDEITMKYQQLNLLAEKVNYNLALIIIGTSGTTGNKSKNSALSISRAKNVKKALINHGISEELLHTTNIGTLPLQYDLAKAKSIHTRKVLFSVMYVDIAQVSSKKLIKAE